MPIYLGKDEVNNSVIGNQIVSEIKSGRIILPCFGIAVTRQGSGARTLVWKDCYSGKTHSSGWSNAQTYRFAVSSYTDPGGVNISGLTSLYNPSYPENQFPTPCNCQNITADSGGANGFFSYVPCNGDAATYYEGVLISGGFNVTACAISGSISAAGATITINSDCSNC